MRKLESIVFQVDFNDLENKVKSERLYALYKRLRKNRSLARFCREAFIEKADQQLHGLEEPYTRLNALVKSKGIPYILEAIHEKETRASIVDQAEIEKAANQIIQALIKGFQTELQAAVIYNPTNTIQLPKKKPDIEKLKALL